ncbi:MAG: hypothetical protein GXO23_03495 [Crenarchaeota archaeon]|nr:hypothetical protein [Thermoproteota archaeon]
MGKYQILTFSLSALLLATVVHLYLKALDNVVQIGSLILGGFRNPLSLLLWSCIVLLAVSVITNLLARADVEHHINTMHPYSEEIESMVIVVKRFLTYSAIGMILTSIVILLLALLRASTMF